MWSAFFIFWLFEAVRAKRSVQRSVRPALARSLIIIALFLLLRIGLGSFFGERSHQPMILNPGAAFAGAAVCAIGIGFAMWARVHLGRNWGMPMSVQKDPELVTSGPYAFVRHPIYSGILLALVGTATIEPRWWLALLVAFFGYFVYAARVEERTMCEQFPAEYPAYARRTKMLVPFLL